MSDNKETKWTELEHLPKWDEEFYEVWTGKKHGKWVMMKTLKPEYRDKPEFQSMIEKEFDVRYNLAHPNIVMINDFEVVPGVGLAIVTDDVYGKSLRELIDAGEVTEAHIEQLRRRLPAAMQYIQENHIVHHPIRPETIIFTENIGNLKLIDVGFEQRPNLSPRDASADVVSFGNVLSEALSALKGSDKRHHTLRHIAEKCKNATPANNPYRNMTSLELALEHRQTDRIYVIAIVFLAIMVALLLIFNSPLRPRMTHGGEKTETINTHTTWLNQSQSPR